MKPKKQTQPHKSTSKALQKRKQSALQTQEIDTALLTKATPKPLERAIRGVLPNAKARTCLRVATFLQLTASGETCLDALESAGLSWGELQAYKGRHPAIADLYQHARELMRDQQIAQRERALLKRGVEGWEDPVYHKGELSGTIRRYSDKCLEIGLKANQPKKYRDREDKAVNVGVSISFTSIGVPEAKQTQEPTPIDVEVQDMVEEGENESEQGAD